jgi:hypothetical protein
MMSEIIDALLALSGLLIIIPILIWVIFNRWQVWRRLLESRLGKLSQEVDKLQERRLCSEETISELREYIEKVYQIVDNQRRFSHFLSINESSDITTLTSITREMLITIRKSQEPEESVSRFLETRRKTISSVFDWMIGR